MKGEKYHQHSHFSASLSQPESAVNIVGLAKTVHYLERLYLEPKKSLTKVGWLPWAVRHQSCSALVRGVNTMTWVFKPLKIDTHIVFPDPSEGEARIQCTLTDTQQLVFIPVENSSGLLNHLQNRMSALQFSISRTYKHSTSTWIVLHHSHLCQTLTSVKLCSLTQFDTIYSICLNFHLPSLGRWAAR